MSKKILIVGGVAGGATAISRLRRLDETAKIILFEKNEHVSFATVDYHTILEVQLKKKMHYL